MPFLHIVVLALVQGITEFLPISSSAHLILVPILSGWQDQGLMIDVAVHVGTLGAVMIYLWRDLWTMARGLVRLVKGRQDAGARLFGFVIAATVPLAVAGFVVKMYYGADLRSLTVIAWTALGFGILLFVADKVGLTVRRIEHMGLSDALIIGVAQVLALVPGTSRSGITITAARVLGMERADGARFSMLLAIPAIIGAGTLEGLELYRAGNAQLTASAGLACGLSFVAALVAILVMMTWIKRATFLPFILYRVVLGILLLAITYGWLV